MRRKAAPVVRVGGFILLVALGLFYLQFGLQALSQFLAQGILTLVGAVGLLWGAVLTLRRKSASGIVFWLTVPLLLLHGVMTVLDLRELPFLIGSIPAPLLAAIAWMITRSGRPTPVEEYDVNDRGHR